VTTFSLGSVVVLMAISFLLGSVITGFIVAWWFYPIISEIESIREKIDNERSKFYE